MKDQIFECQRNSYLRTFSAKVLSCEKCVHKDNGKQVDGFNVILSDTVLFPEGGGQPDDRGTIDGKPVHKVSKVNGEAVHFVECSNELPIGEMVELEVDWNRRWDHMQQHTAQHVISAVAEDMFNLVTTSWTLGEEVSYIELDSPSVESDTIDKLEAIVNDKITEGCAVEVKLYEKGSPELSKVRTRFEVPEDTDCIRVIHINGVDNNTCCGTHVSNLSHLQAIKLLYVEKGKKNKCSLYFVAGQRLLRYLSKCVQREKSLTSILKNGPEDHFSLVDKLQKSVKQNQKNCLNVVRDMALLEARVFKSLSPKPSFYSLHRKEGINDFVSIFLNEVSSSAENTVFLLTVAQDSSTNAAGYVALAGSETFLQQCVDIAEEMLKAKGIVKQGRFQAKVNSLANKAQFEERIKNVVIAGKSEA